MTAPTQKVRAFLAWFEEMREATDLLAAAFRIPIHRLTVSLISLQALFAGLREAGVLDAILPNRTINHVVTWVGLCSTVIAFYSQCPRESVAMIVANQRAASVVRAAVRKRIDP